MAEEAPAEEMTEEEAPAEDDGFTVTTGVGFRAALRMQSATDPEDLDDISFDEIAVEPRFSGRVTDIVAWTANLTVSGRTIDTAIAFPTSYEARALDLVGQLDFHDAFHVWVGRMLTPSDRSNFSGAWFMSPWNYPGVYFAGPVGYVGPRGTEEIGRETGVVAWGNDESGKFKYYAGVMDLDSNVGDPSAATVSPLLAARVGYAFIGSEPGFYGSSTYYGGQDVLALGAAFRYQKEFYVLDTDPTTGEVLDADDVVEFNADLLAEFNVGGTLTGEVGYYNFASDSAPVSNHLMLVGSYTTEDAIGIGKIQPVVRYQMATGENDLAQSQFSAGVNYVIKDYFAKLALTFTRSSGEMDVDGDGTVEDAETSAANLLQLGFQIQQ